MTKFNSIKSENYSESDHYENIIKKGTGIIAAFKYLNNKDTPPDDLLTIYVNSVHQQQNKNMNILKRRDFAIPYCNIMEKIDE